MSELSSNSTMEPCSWMSCVFHTSLKIIEACESHKKLSRDLILLKEYLKQCCLTLGVLQKMAEDVAPPAICIPILQSMHRELVSILASVNIYCQRYRLKQSCSARPISEEVARTRSRLTDVWTVFLVAHRTPTATDAPVHITYRTPSDVHPFVSEHAKKLLHVIHLLQQPRTCPSDVLVAMIHLHTAIGDEVLNANSLELNKLHNDVQEMSVKHDSRLRALVRNMKTALAFILDAGSPGHTEFPFNHPPVTHAKLDYITTMVEQVVGTMQQEGVLESAANQSGSEQNESCHMSEAARDSIADFKCIQEIVQDHLIQSSSMACPVLRMPFQWQGLLEARETVGCGCIVSKCILSLSRKRGTCLACSTPLPPGTLRDNKDAHPALQAVLPRLLNSGFSMCQVALEDVKDMRKFGHGGQAELFTALWLGRSVVVKKLWVSGAGVAGIEQARIETMNRVCIEHVACTVSPHVCRLLGVGWDTEHCYTLMEVCENSLHKLVMEDYRGVGLPLPRVVRIAYYMASALDELHEQVRALHLDVTPGNVLTIGTRYRLCDFGMSKNLTTCVTRVMPSGYSAGYASPEHIQGQAGRPADVYGLGATLIFAATGALPVRQGGGLDVSRVCGGHEGLSLLLSLMTSPNPANRPKLPEVLDRLSELTSDDGAFLMCALPLDCSLPRLCDLIGRSTPKNQVDLSQKVFDCEGSNIAFSTGLDLRPDRTPSHTHWTLDHAARMRKVSMHSDQCTLIAGDVILPKNGQLVITGSLLISHTHISGTNANVFVSEGSSVTFLDVTFSGCGVIVTQDASVKLHDCIFTDAPIALFLWEGHAYISDTTVTGSTITGIYGTGRDASIKLMRTSIACSAKEGLVIAAGAQCAMTDCHIRGSEGGRGVCVTGKWSKIDALDSEMSENRLEGLIIEGGAIAKMTGCQFMASGAGKGVVVQGMGSNMDANDCQMSCNLDAGLYVLNGATSRLESCVLAGSEQQQGLYVAGRGSSTYANNCQSSDNAGAGVLVRGGASINLHSCEMKCSRGGEGMLIVDKGSCVDAVKCVMSDNLWAGLAASSGARARLDGCWLKGSLDKQGMHVEGEGTVVRLTSSLLNGNKDVGVKVMDGATAKLRQCEMKANSGDAGVYVTGMGTLVDAVECQVSGNKISGMIVLSGGEARLQASSVKSNHGSHGVIASGPGTRLIAKSSFMSENRVTGVFVTDSGFATLESCELLGSVEGQGLGVSGVGSSVTATHCKMNDNKSNGVHVASGAAVTLDSCWMMGSKEYRGLEATGVDTIVKALRCEMSRNDRTGCYIHSGASASLNRCEMASNRLEGTEITGETSSVAMVECTVTANRQAGIYMHAWATTDLQSCKVSGNGYYGVVAQGPGSADVRECVLTGNTQAGLVALSGAQVTLTGSQLKASKGSNGMEASGSGTVVRADECQFGENHRAGVLTQNSASVNLVGCIIRDNKYYGVVGETSAKAVMKECVTIGNQSGACKQASGATLTLQDLANAEPARIKRSLKDRLRFT